MTNKTMLSVERELLERILDSIGFGEREELRALLDEPDEPFNPQGWSIDHSAGRPILMHNKCSVIEAEQAYGLLNLIETAAQHQGEPVAWQFYQDGKWWNGDDRIKDHRKNTENSGYKTRELYAEQPEPAADHTQCEECKGWGYHENHHEGGGTECGECGGSGNAPVALVMPERLNTEGGYSLEAETWYNLALDDVASLNGVKP